MKKEYKAIEIKIIELDCDVILASGDDKNDNFGSLKDFQKDNF